MTDLNTYLSQLIDRLSQMEAQYKLLHEYGEELKAEHLRELERISSEVAQSYSEYNSQQEAQYPLQPQSINLTVQDVQEAIHKIYKLI